MNQPKPNESKALEFVPYGQTDRVKLTLNIVKTFIATPTKSGRTCTDRDAMRFMMLCQARRLNPFEGDAFLVGFDTKYGPQFNLITAHQAYLKRAELHPKFSGMESGITILGETGDPVDIMGELRTESQALLGAWARVTFSDPKRSAVYRRLGLGRFRQLISRAEVNGGPWKDDLEGMVVKCTEADALRSAFPTLLGGLYTKDEVSINIDAVDNSNAPELAAALVETNPGPSYTAAHSDALPMNWETSEQESEPPRPDAPPETDKPQTPQDKISALVIGAKSSFDDFHTWCTEINILSHPENVASFEEIPTPEAKRILRVEKAMLKRLAELAEGGNDR